MISVTCREHQHALILNTVFCLKISLIAEFFYCIKYILLCTFIYIITHDMSRIFHKVKIINLFKIIYLIFKRFNNRFFSVINKYQDMRCLKRCIFSYTLSWRNTFDNCTLTVSLLKNRILQDQAFRQYRDVFFRLAEYVLHI